MREILESGNEARLASTACDQPRALAWSRISAIRLAAAESFCVTDIVIYGKYSLFYCLSYTTNYFDILILFIIYAKFLNFQIIELCADTERIPAVGWIRSGGLGNL
jgi:hypothetical protein